MSRLRALPALGLGLAAWGVFWLVVTQAVILPALNPAGVFAYADRLDWRDLLTHPWLLVLRLGDDCLMPVAMALFGLIAGILPLWVPFALYGGAMALLMIMPLRNPGIRAISLRDAATS